MKNIDKLALFLLIIGGINWGLYGVFQFNLFEYLFGEHSWINRVLYFFIGVSGFYIALIFKAVAGRWHSKSR